MGRGECGFVFVFGRVWGVLIWIFGLLFLGRGDADVYSGA